MRTITPIALAVFVIVYLGIFRFFHSHTTVMYVTIAIGALILLVCLGACVTGKIENWRIQKRIKDLEERCYKFKRGLIMRVMYGMFVPICKDCIQSEIILKKGFL